MPFAVIRCKALDASGRTTRPFSQVLGHTALCNVYYLYIWQFVANQFLLKNGKDL